MKRVAVYCAAPLLGAALLAGAALAHGPGEAHEEKAPADSSLRYELPEAGSYALPPISRVEEHRLLDPDGEEAPLLGLAPGQVAVVSFVYANCSQATGCPLAFATLRRVDRMLAARPDLAPRVRLVTVSFDPAHDTPALMGRLRQDLRPASDWRFLTADSPSRIRPVLEDFGQDARPLTDAGGAALGLFGHVLKVFLVDSSGGVRNIYSVGFLSPELLIRDAETLLLEARANGEALVLGEAP